MFEDRWGLATTADNAEAVGHYSDVVLHYLGFSRDVGNHLKAALSADPDMVLAQCIRGYFFQLFCNPVLDGKAKQSLERAQASLADRGGTARERRHVEALGAWVAGDWEATTEAWEEILFHDPQDILALRLIHFTHFYAGAPERMRDTAARVLSALDESAAGYGFVEGTYAFGLEESGEYGRAEALGRSAVSRNPNDIWAVHAVAHVMEMQGRHKDGIAWLAETEAGWSGANNFAYHVWWHRALFHLEREEFDAALGLYDAGVRGDIESDDYLDVTNAIALLWRLESCGVDVGARWQELGEKAAKRCRDQTLAFADAHYVLALKRTGRDDDVERMLAGIEDARRAGTTQGRVHDRVGAALCRALAAAEAGDPEAAAQELLPIRYHVRAIGGSHAQRDLFQQNLIEALIAAERLDHARALLAERVAERPCSPWTWRRLARVLTAAGDRTAAAVAEAQIATACAA